MSFLPVDTELVEVTVGENQAVINILPLGSDGAAERIVKVPVRGTIVGAAIFIDTGLPGTVTIEDEDHGIELATIATPGRHSFHTQVAATDKSKATIDGAYVYHAMNGRNLTITVEGANAVKGGYIVYLDIL